MCASTPVGRGLLAAILILLLGACAESQADDVSPATVGHVHGLGLDPGDDRLRVATHDGLFILEDGELQRVGDGTHDLMGFVVSGEGRFLASGHPVGGSPPEPMGLVHSTDAGATWDVVSLGGQADLHSLDVEGRIIAAHDAFGGRIVRSLDSGQTFDTLAEMGALDVVLLDDRTVLVAGIDGALTRLDGNSAEKLPDTPRLVNVDRTDVGLAGLGPEGQVWVSTDATSWAARGQLDGVPAALEAGGSRWYAATSTGIHASDDEGMSWQRVS